MRYVLPLLKKSRVLNIDKNDYKVIEPIIVQAYSELDLISFYRHYISLIQERLNSISFFSTKENKVAIVTDFLNVNRECFTPIKANKGTVHATYYESLVSIAIIVFPEINFFCPAFFAPKDELTTKEADILEKHLLSKVYTSHWPTALFDETGLRNWLRARSPIGSGEQRFKFPNRAENAACIEDETEYAFMHALACYRFGYRTTIINSYSRAKFYLSDVESVPTKFSLICEDMSLNFYDKPEQVHLSHLDEKFENRADKKFGRAHHFKYLSAQNKYIKHRFLITTGQSSWKKDNNEKATLDVNKTFYKTCHAHTEIVYKPTGGLLDLWAEFKLLKQPSKFNSGDHGTTKQRSGNAVYSNEEYFTWPCRTDSRPQKNLQSNHGSIGMHYVCADMMIERAKQLSVSKDLIKRATAVVLATEAGEMLEGKSLYLSTEACLLKHKLEVVLESEFNGFGYHVDAQKRLNEIKLETAFTASWLSEGKKDSAGLNTELTIISELAKLYRAGSLFEEEELCLKRIRTLNRKLVFSACYQKLVSAVSPKKEHDTKTNKFAYVDFFEGGFGLVSNSVVYYFEKLLNGASNIVVAMLAWVSVFTLFWDHTWGSWKDVPFPCNSKKSEDLVMFVDWFKCTDTSSILNSYEMVAAAFFEYNIDTLSTEKAMFSTMIVLVAIIHIGLIVSYLYSLIARR